MRNYRAPATSAPATAQPTEGPRVAVPIHASVNGHAQTVVRVSVSTHETRGAR